MSKTLRWWLFFCISLTVRRCSLLWNVRELYEKDVTKLVSPL